MAEPVRTCVGCGRRDTQRALTRLVARDAGLDVDCARARTGRGAWVHARRGCLDTFARRGGFVRSLRCVIAKPERERVIARVSEVIA
jgi:uncharacterized protein